MRVVTGLLLLLVAFVLTGCATSTGGAVPRPFPGAALPPSSVPPASPETIPPQTTVTPLPALVLTGLGLRGTPYRNGGSDPDGFDCSGFVQWVFNLHGIRLPRETKEQYRVGLSVSLDDVQPGDLVFFETIGNGPSHVGIAIGDRQFVHAPSSRGVVRVESYGISYWATRFLGARRIPAATAHADTKGLP